MAIKNGKLGNGRSAFTPKERVRLQREMMPKALIDPKIRKVYQDIFRDEIYKSTRRLQENPKYSQQLNDIVEDAMEQSEKLAEKHNIKRQEIEKKKTFGRKTKKAFQKFVRSPAGKAAGIAARIGGKFLGPAGITLSVYDLYKAGIFDDTGLEDPVFGGHDVGFKKGGQIEKKIKKTKKKPRGWGAARYNK